VVNLRGTIVPIVDMRIKFNLGKAEYDQFTVVIILNVAGRVVGMVVDGVSDVITLLSPCLSHRQSLTVIREGRRTISRIARPGGAMLEGGAKRYMRAACT
jgi:chemotaxis signal transduction protein